MFRDSISSIPGETIIPLWLVRHVKRMPRNRLPSVMKHYSPTGRRNNARPLKRLLDTWDRNGSTSGQTPWQIYDDDDDDGDFNKWHWSNFHKTNAQIAKELKIAPILDKLPQYKKSWIQHVNRMPRNRLPKVMKHYCPTGRRNHGRPLKRLLDTWDRNESTSGPTPWQIYNDDAILAWQKTVDIRAVACRFFTPYTKEVSNSN